MGASVRTPPVLSTRASTPPASRPMPSRFHAGLGQDQVGIITSSSSYAAISWFATNRRTAQHGVRIQGVRNGTSSRSKDRGVQGRWVTRNAAHAVLYLEPMCSPRAGRQISLTRDCVVGVSFLSLSGPGADGLLEASKRKRQDDEGSFEVDTNSRCALCVWTGGEESRCFLFTYPPYHWPLDTTWGAIMPP